MNDQNDHDEGDSGIDAVRMAEVRAGKLDLTRENEK